MSGSQSTVGIIEQLALWQTSWEAPLAPAGDIVRVQAPGAVADGMAFDVMQTHSDGAAKEAAFRFRIGKPGFESYGGIHADALVLLEERRAGI
jgi:hypothetical protein